ncbi:MAG: helix-turn-helix domain-containing protein [Acidimicrobiales bacterium]
MSASPVVTPGATPARIVDLATDGVPPGWKLAPLAESGPVVVAFDPDRAEVTVVHGQPGTALVAGLAAAGHRFFGSAGEASVYLRVLTGPERPVAPEALTVSVEEAARILGISRALAYELARRRELPVLRLGRRLVVPAARLRQMVDGVSPDTRAG